jgi:hypothetical protein
VRSAPFSLVLALCATIGCGTDPLTEVLVSIDAEPGLRGGTETLEVRVLDHEGVAVLDQSRDVSVDMLPVSLPLVPRDGDAARTFVVEATLLDPSGAILARGRARGGYEAEEVREGLLCLEDSCQGVLCGDTTSDCLPGGECLTCRGPDGTCEDALLETFALGELVSNCGR